MIGRVTARLSAKPVWWVLPLLLAAAVLPAGRLRSWLSRRAVEVEVR